MIEKLHNYFANKKILLLGFGLEGQSSMRLLEKLNCAKSITIADKKDNENYLSELDGDYDIIMKSPGIPLFGRKSKGEITGQADLFLRFCENKVVGITGTKGKSTTSSLLHHILTECKVKSKLTGNIGIPPLDIIDELNENVIVCELSCHQLEYVKASPGIAILLNIYEEHLDHYIDFEHYKKAKENIFRFQSSQDILIRGEDVNSSNIDSTKAKLRGKHNIQNIAVAVKAAALLGVDEESAIQAAYRFGGLSHRLEVLYENNQSKRMFVNDSISTIPAAAIAAVEAFPETDTIIIGGMDRGIDYSTLITFLQNWIDNPSALAGDLPPAVRRNIIALPDSGHKIAEGIPNVYKARDMRDAVNYAKKVTKQCCVLSPAAASYGFYKNFEERGKHFKSLVENTETAGK